MVDRKGQAAMEYLMTYGWAILVIVIVLAVLFSFTSLFRVGDQCLFSQKFFSCGNPNPQVLTDGSLIFTLGNQGQKAVELSAASCVSGSVEPTSFTPITGERRILPGGSLTFSRARGIRCLSPQGDSLTLREGDEFRGRLVIRYRYEGEPEEYEERSASATLVSTVVAASGNAPGGNPNGEA